MTITRRAALIGIGAALATPAIVRAESIMRVVAPRVLLPYKHEAYLKWLDEQFRLRWEDQLSFGMSFADQDGRRIDPRTVFIEPLTQPKVLEAREVVAKDWSYSVIPIPSAHRPRWRLPKVERA